MPYRPLCEGNGTNQTTWDTRLGLCVTSVGVSGVLCNNGGVQVPRDAKGRFT